MKSDRYTGGIVGIGITGNTRIINCYNDEKSIVDGENCGGIIGGGGTSSSKIYVYNCYNLGKITATNSAGGIAGSISDCIKCINVFSTGNISGEAAGGIIGSAWWNNANSNKFENCYFLKSDTVEKSSGKNIVVDAKMLEKLANTEIEEINNYIENNEDNIDTSLWKKWKLGENGYPVFK